ncbi:hypothetical protein PBI_DEWDROP_45 [Microbacterium phage Dewdrop]|nr:hypothetical protein PBI_LEAF_45 [Microbacterium phage Leaf]QGZ17414.1 hypothetical protein PBI_DEWDROP_45 [Microbacterium phage Dewdrop]
MMSESDESDEQTPAPPRPITPDMIAAAGWCAPSDEVMFLLKDEPLDAPIPEVEIPRLDLPEVTAPRGPIDWDEFRRKAAEHREMREKALLALAENLNLPPRLLDDSLPQDPGPDGSERGHWEYAIEVLDEEEDELPSVITSTGAWMEPSRFYSVKAALLTAEELGHEVVQVLRRWVPDPFDWKPLPKHKTESTGESKEQG